VEADKILVSGTTSQTVKQLISFGERTSSKLREMQMKFIPSNIVAVYLVVMLTWRNVVKSKI
jgi:hypothetical protein